MSKKYFYRVTDEHGAVIFDHQGVMALPVRTATDPGQIWQA